METQKKPDMVSHPPHYQSEAGLEVIDVIKAFTADLKGIEATDTGNIIKYICRWNHKNGLEDLKKAKWYLEHLIKNVEEKNTASEFTDRIMAAEGWKISLTSACKHEGETMHPYGDKPCFGETEFTMCKGRSNCDKYEPIENN